MTPKVSVIIPVYNAAKDIERCCRALFSQTLENMEFLFVDDCSKDNSYSLIQQTIEDYPNRKAQVKLLQQSRNMGVASARQRGLDEATGEFIIHCDSDDWPESDMYEVLYQKAKDEKAEVVYCDYYVEYASHREYVAFPDSSIKRPSFNIAPIEGAVWNKLIKYDLIQRIGVKFLENVGLGEDFAFVTPCCVKASETAVVHKPLYHYNQQNAGSITHNYTKERFLQVISLAKYIDELFQEKGLSQDFAFEINYLKFQAKSFFLMYPEVRDISFWKETFPECDEYIMHYGSPLYLRLAAWLISNRMSCVANIILRLRDTLSKRNR